MRTVGGDWERRPLLLHKHVTALLILEEKQRDETHTLHVKRHVTELY